jgi:hypothetical protein
VIILTPGKKHSMIVIDTTHCMVTAAIADWIGGNPDRLAWMAQCLHRHISGDWGDLCGEDRVANDRVVEAGEGRILSSFHIPVAISGDIRETDRVWIITDDIGWDESPTTVLFPSDY